MNAYTELQERRQALLFTVEQGCRCQGIRQWEILRKYLQAVAYVPQGRDLLIDNSTVEEYIAHRQELIARKKQSPASRTAERLLATRDRQLAEAFTRMVESLPAEGGVSCRKPA